MILKSASLTKFKSSFMGLTVSLFGVVILDSLGYKHKVFIAID